MIDRLPIEIVYHILSYVPFSSFTKLYQSLPKQIIDEALFLKLKQAARLQQGLLELVSTNLHELNAPYHYSLKNFSKLGYPNNIINNKKVNNNESFIPLYFRYMDIKHQLLWFTPDIKSMNYYFEVKDFYVSHGKLVLRQKQQETVTSANATQQKVIGSLWDIRNKFPSTRSGNFSGAASNYNSSTAASSINNPTNTQFIKITMDTSSPPSSSPSSHSTNNTNNINNNNKHDKSLLMKKKMSSTILLDACCVLGLEDDKQKIVNQMNDPSTYRHNDPPRPSLYLDHHHLYLPKTVSQQISSPWHTTFTCGYFVIEQVGISISEFLDFF